MQNDMGFGKNLLKVVFWKLHKTFRKLFFKQVCHKTENFVGIGFLQDNTVN